MRFIPGSPPATARLLARFLPPLAEGQAAAYIEQYSRPGDLIFDLFSQSPLVALEALHLGRRVLAASPNPVARLACSLALRPPTETELNAALTLLGDQPKDGDRLENYLRGLYRTQCGNCGAETDADTFEWEEDALVAKTYFCPTCGGGLQQSPGAPADVEQAQRFPLHGLDYHLLLDRLAPLNDPDRPHAQDALAAYPARTLAAIAAVLMKLDTLHTDRDTRRCLCGLLVAAFDTTCVLGQERPKILTALPRRYTEVNFWLALERALALLAGAAMPEQSVALETLLTTTTPAIHAPPDPARDLSARVPPGACTLSLSATIRPNQAFWTLSAAWAAWLWGRDSVAALRTVLHRRRYDWDWHTQALTRSFAAALPTLAPGGKLISLMTEAEPGFVACALAAADCAGYQLTGAALRPDTAEAQFMWQAEAPPVPETALPAKDLTQPARAAVEAMLRERGEPARWNTVHFSAWRALAENHCLRHLPDDPLSLVNRQLEPLFRNPQYFQRLEAEPQDDLTTGLWYLPLAPADGIPLSDRVEALVVRLLSQNQTLTELDLERAVYTELPGFNSPGRALVMACLQSYAAEVEPGLWRLRPEDEPAQRAREVESIETLLRLLGQRYAYTISDTQPMVWSEGERAVYQFVILASAKLSAPLLTPPQPARRRFLVLPGGRAGLAAYKLRRDPRLRQVLQSDNWLIVKFRHIRRMATDEQLTRATLEPAFWADPLDETRQLQLQLLHTLL